MPLPYPRDSLFASTVPLLKATSPVHLVKTAVPPHPALSHTLYSARFSSCTHYLVHLSPLPVSSLSGWNADPVRVRTSVCLGHLCFPSTWVRTGTSTPLVLHVLLDEWGAPLRAFGIQSARLACYLPTVVLHGCQPRMLQPCQCDKEPTADGADTGEATAEERKETKALKTQTLKSCLSPHRLLMEQSVAEALPELVFILA